MLDDSWRLCEEAAHSIQLSCISLRVKFAVHIIVFYMKFVHYRSVLCVHFLTVSDQISDKMSCCNPFYKVQHKTFKHNHRLVTMYVFCFC
ncbi:hypothetical protein PR048_022101 [Dryococelus australis]|uniref:Uncharacterized protein n=1 Tax=Dryococelus australis TaxID=614101 RepID=A0ABQ9H046_9NEOP|nr:hypothetical protein PR048_022101 [Dryococelus australis]